MNKQELIEKIKKAIKNEISLGNYYREVNGYGYGAIDYEPYDEDDAQSVANDIILELQEDLEQLDKPQKPVVPCSVGSLIEFYREKGVTLKHILNCFNEWADTDNEHTDGVIWIVSNSETFVRAWLDGYEVEKEPLYCVKMPFRAWDEESAELKTEFLYLGYDITSDETMFFPTNESRKVFGKDFKTKLNEVTIKSADEKYWAFAVPVEEVIEG